MGNKLRIIGQNIHLNIGEQEWLKHMQQMFGCTEQEALEEIIQYKREQAFGFEQQGNWLLAKQLLQEIDEWDDSREAEFREHMKEIEKTTIVEVIKPHLPKKIISSKDFIKK